MNREPAGRESTTRANTDALLAPDALRALIAGAKKRDEDALTALVTHFHRHIYLTAYAIMRTPEDAEDVTQDTFLKAFAKLHTLEHPDAFPAWLTTIATRLAIDKNRRKTRLAETPLITAQEQARLDPRRDPTERMILAEALETLSSAHRATLLLYERDGYDYKEIAEILNIPIGTVKSRLANAKRLLREVFESREDDR
ncbi:MAG: RNA polymerase sigma factor [Firmicutes bacterium]|nr:RNA polymerase sigma factor [Bacillota bacterium]